MNKLVQKNPIQKFKQGKRIVKAGFGEILRRGINTMIANAFNPSGTVYPDGAYFEEKRPNGQVIKGRWQGGKKVYQTTTPTTPTPTYYTTRAYRNSLNIDRLGLKSRADVLAYQKELNKLGANIKEDGIWGDNTNAAYLKYKGFKPGNDEILIPTTSVTTSTNSIGGTDIKDINNIHPEKLDVGYNYNYNPVYDRSMTRDWIRNNLKINPYNVSGAQRRALRYWLNGDKEGQNYNKNILGVFGDLSQYAKKGGTLLNRNPIERFKSNFFRKVEQ